MAGVSGEALNAGRCLAAFSTILLLAAVPVLLASHPPLVDLPSHIGRVYLLSKIGQDPFISQHYEITSWIVPNLGTDVVLLLAGMITSLEVAAKLLVVLIFALIFGGTLVLHYVLFKRRSWWPFIAALFLYNYTLIMGFMSYQFGIGVFLWATAAWMANFSNSWPRRLILGALFSIALFFCHLMALGLYALFIAGLEIEKSVRTVLLRPLPAVAGLALAAIQFIPVAILLWFSPTAADTGGEALYLPIRKVYSPFLTFTVGHPWLDILSAVLLLACIALGVRALNWRFARPMRVPAILLVMAFVLLPNHLGGTAYVDTRLPVAILFVLIASTDVTVRRRGMALALVLPLIALMVTRAVGLCMQWQAYDMVVAEYRAAFEELAPESTLFAAHLSGNYTATGVPRPLPENIVAGLSPGLQRIYDFEFRLLYARRLLTPSSIPSLAVLDRPVIATTVFVSRTQNPLALRQRFEPLVSDSGKSRLRLDTREEIATLMHELRERQRSAGREGSPAYLLLFSVGGDFSHLPADARTVGAGSHFRLVRLM
jgi:hypothetical protein